MSRITARELAQLGAEAKIEEIKLQIKEFESQIRDLRKIANGKVYRQKKPKGKKLHWMQRPENREAVLARVEKARAAANEIRLSKKQAR
jgi:hypothetical protein